MTPIPTTKGKPSLTNTRGHALTAIKGIGPARQEWFRQSLNVHTCQDLAALSAAEIEARLKAEGKIVARSEIEGWLTQARQLTVPADPPARRAAGPAPAAAGSQAKPPAGQGEWKPVASFVIEFQVRQDAGQAAQRRTSVHYVEADKSQTWPGVEGGRLCAWMLDQLGEKPQQEPEKVVRAKELARVQPTALPPVRVALAQLCLFQPPQAESPSAIGAVGRPFLGFIRGDEPFTLQASFELAGPEMVRPGLTYHAQFYAHNLSTGASIHLGDTQPDTLVEGQLTYTATLPGMCLPAGMYRLRVLATLQTTPPSLGHLEVPLLEVV